MNNFIINMKMAAKILEILREYGPLKSTELVVKCFEQDMDAGEFIGLLDYLVKQNKIKEVEYNDLRTLDRIKSIYFLTEHEPKVASDGE